MKIAPRQNFLCNFRAPNDEWYQIWIDFKKQVKAQGSDICYVTLSLCRSWLRSLEASTNSIISQANTPMQIVNLQQQNTFVYSVQIPRRTPFEIICPRKMPIRTLWSRAFQAYIVEKARDLDRSFSFFDYPELGHDFFRKCILKLKERDKAVPLRPRTNPRYYVLKDWISKYPTMQENNGVKPKFTRNSVAERVTEGSLIQR